MADVLREEDKLLLERWAAADAALRARQLENGEYTLADGRAAVKFGQSLRVKEKAVTVDQPIDAK
ncbi:MAG: hypothetical protein ABL982_00220 [Vicinamibacterales bacterium]